MKKTIYKAFWAWEFEKEEKWLNEMAQQGLALVDVGFCKYVFEQTQPDKYTIRLELLENPPSNDKSKDYIAFVEETGAEYVCCLLRWAYFRKEKSKGEFDLYSDTQSRISQLNRILFLVVILSAVNVFNGLNNICIYLSSDFNRVSNLNIGIFALAVGLFLLKGGLSIKAKKIKLQKSKNIFE